MFPHRLVGPPLRTVLAIVITASLLLTSTLVWSAGVGAQGQNIEHRTGKPRREKPEGLLPDLAEVQRESQDEREAPAAIPSTFFVVSFGGVNAQETKCVPSTTPPRDKAVRLQLTTTVTEARYSVEDGSKLLFLTLNLDYLNVGSRAILLDKHSSFIYRKLVTKNVKALTACKYLYDAVSHPISVENMEQAGFRRDAEPEKSEFAELRPGESISLQSEIILRLYEGTKDTDDRLHPGKYVLQVRVAAWYYYADPAEWEQKWGNQAYLWSENVTSEPMPFTVEKR